MANALEILIKDAILRVYAGVDYATWCPLIVFPRSWLNMMRHYKKLLLIVLVAFMAMTVPAPKTQAFEPISMSILAGILIPIVLPYVIKAMPYIWQGMKNMTYAMFECGVEMFGIMYLPVGMFETMFGWPFGLFRHGLSTTWEGCKAPFSAMGMMFLVPFKTVGVM